MAAPSAGQPGRCQWDTSVASSVIIEQIFSVSLISLYPFLRLSLRQCRHTSMSMSIFMSMFMSVSESMSVPVFMSLFTYMSISMPLRTMATFMYV